MFNVTDTSALRVIWGGAGADVVNMSVSGLGIMIANVTGLTAANFHQFSTDLLGLGAIDWSQIGVLLINPDSADRITLDYGYGVYEMSVGQIGHAITGVFPTASGDLVSQQYGTFSYLGDTTFGDANGVLSERHPIIVGTYEQNFLSGYEGTAFAPADVYNTLTIREYRHPAGNFVYAGDYGTEEGGFESSLANGRGLFGDGWNYEIDREYDLSRASFVSSCVMTGPNSGSRDHYFFELKDTPVERYDWFMLGGSLSGSAIFSNNDIAGTMPNVPENPVSDWLLVA